MGFFDKLKKSNGGFIFLSHSHDDIEKVRKIRNELEKDGFEPLCFYLKCLSDDTEIEDLIKREIDAREWFIFLNSENSRKSKWVTLEREYITRTDKKKILTIDIDDEQSIADVIKTINHNLRIFISSSAKDRKLERKIYDKLKEKDYLVFSIDDIPTEIDWTSAISNAIHDASQEGAVLALITPNSVESPMVKKEIQYALACNGKIIPIIVDNAGAEDNFLQMMLSHLQMYKLSGNPTDEELENLVDAIGNAIIKK